MPSEPPSGSHLWAVIHGSAGGGRDGLLALDGAFASRGLRDKVPQPGGGGGGLTIYYFTAVGAGSPEAVREDVCHALPQLLGVLALLGMQTCGPCPPPPSCGASPVSLWQGPVVIRTPVTLPAPVSRCLDFIHTDCLSSYVQVPRSFGARTSTGEFGEDLQKQIIGENPAWLRLEEPGVELGRGVCYFFQ